MPPIDLENLTQALDEREMFEVMAHHRFLDFQYQRKLYMGGVMEPVVFQL